MFSINNTLIFYRNFVCTNCWLVNFWGQQSSHVSINQAQEHNIKKIKVTYCSEGPSIDWEYLQKLHPAIPIIDAVAAHVEQEFKTLTWGKKHTVPQAELDIQTLQRAYHESGIHEYCPGRKAPTKNDFAKDVILKGVLELNSGQTIQ